MTNTQVMEQFTSDFGFTVAFLIGALGINVFFGSKVLYWYLMLVFLSMLVMNYQKLNYFFQKGVK